MLFPAYTLGEADLVIHHLKALISAGVAPCQVAVIAPYSLQVHNSSTFGGAPCVRLNSSLYITSYSAVFNRCEPKRFSL